MEKNKNYTELKVSQKKKDKASDNGHCVKVALVVISLLVAMIILALVTVSVVLSLQIIQLNAKTASAEVQQSFIAREKRSSDSPTLKTYIQQLQVLDRAIQALDRAVQVLNTSQQTNDSPTMLLEQFSYENQQYIFTLLSGLNASIQAVNLQLWNETKKLDAQIVSTRQQLLENIQTGDVQLWNETKKQIDSNQQLQSESIQFAKLRLWNETEKLNVEIDNTRQQLSGLNESILVGDHILWNETIRLNMQIDSNHQQLNGLIEDIQSELSTLLLGERQNQIEQLNQTLAILQLALSNPGHYSIFPALSCSTLPPYSLSGYYWVRASNGSAVHVYCNMTLLCGGVRGWTRVAHLDMTNSTHQCPSGFRQQTESNKSTCVTNSTEYGCTSVFLDDNSVPYSSVCGLIRGYQFGYTDAFFANTEDINSHYIDGVSLTYGSGRRQHIWTFAAGGPEGSNTELSCPCQTERAANPPSFVQNDYFCDTGFHNRHQHSFSYSNPLWDGAGCGPNTNCCRFNTPPWFYKQLPQPTSEGIEMRVCRSYVASEENIALERMSIFVR